MKKITDIEWTEKQQLYTHYANKFENRSLSWETQSKHFIPIATVGNKNQKAAKTHPSKKKYQAQMVSPAEFFQIIKEWNY